MSFGSSPVKFDRSMDFESLEILHKNALTYGLSDEELSELRIDMKSVNNLY